ncbi:AmmeMemoRadiSam system protein B [Kwoniella shivajii]|uniref:AmmeMemoRadiSam system protein B n=1 Tax=Kwoniella shivajii TaxID=564305 RepID=A0ABZ1D760_9TREE|nr:AmmeMemoRadiSam system protein B [Kwoniella shivajii]
MKQPSIGDPRSRKMSHSVREATHAGSWYSAKATELSSQLKSNLSKVTPLPDLAFNPPEQNAKAVIAPHAGYSYSGPAAAWAYASIPTDKIKRIFLLGPSHHSYLPGVALSTFGSYGTPLGDIPLDTDTIASLKQTGIFSEMKHSVDEDEHSLEMHLPYIRHIFKDRKDLTLVPILVGHPNAQTSKELSKVLAQYWSDEETFFIISSDFCHWGTRFSCTPYYHNAPPPPNAVPPVTQETLPASFEPPELTKRFSSAVSNPDVPIWKSIQYMDHEGMDLLRYPAEFAALEKWEAYLDETKNTICGRNPITVLLGLIQHVYHDKPEDQKPTFTFVRYEQSSKCVNGKDSSVSYVSGVLKVPK